MAHKLKNVDSDPKLKQLHNKNEKAAAAARLKRNAERKSKNK